MKDAGREPIEIVTGPVLRAIGSLSPETLVPGGSRHPKRVKRKSLRVPSFYFPDGRERTAPTKRALELGHGHPRLEVCLPLGGTPLLAVDGALYRLAEPDLAMLAPGTPHFECCDSPRRRYELLWLVLVEGVSSMHVTEYAPRSGYTVHSRALIGALGQQVARLTELVGEGRWTSAKIVELRTALATVASRAARFLASGSGGESADAPEAVRLAEDFVRTHYLEALSVADVARAAHLSPNYLSVLFRESTGRTVLEAIHELKLAEARTQLSESDSPVKRIAFELGFESPHYFSRFFRRSTGLSPSEFRARNRPGG